jgi:hypothetical protein
VVVNTFVRPTTTPKRKTVRRQFVAVLWDGSKTPSEHEQMRLVHEHEFAQIKQDYINAIGG